MKVQDVTAPLSRQEVVELALNSEMFKAERRELIKLHRVLQRRRAKQARRLRAVARYERKIAAQVIQDQGTDLNELNETETVL